MKKQKVLLGITGGIAAYKCGEIASLLVKKGYEVHVVMTEAATKFISPLTLRTITGNPVATKLFDKQEKLPVPHIHLADKVDLAIIAPATANILGKITAGLADNLLTAVILALNCPVIIAPAMNGNMYRHPAVQNNIEQLKQWGFFFVGPGVGHLACGTEDKGRMAEPEDIIVFLESLAAKNPDLSGKTFLVTAGPTREPIDPVRYLSNQSSGKMGYAMAEAARERGAVVHLVSGPVNLKAPLGVNIYKVTTAQEMKSEVMLLSSTADVIVKAAAVADYRPAVYNDKKVKKGLAMKIALEQNPDILMELGRKKEKEGFFLVGFAAETNNVQDNALKKLDEKNLDLIVANDVSQPLSGFDVDTNEVQLLFKDGEKKKLPLMGKKEAAHMILDGIINRLNRAKGQ